LKYLFNLLVLLLLLSFSANATTIYVKKSATGSKNGTSWTNAYTDLQNALDAATTSDQIWVAAGTYLPTDVPDKDGRTSTGATDRNNAFHLATNMKIYGGFAGTETLLSQRDAATNITILSGDFSGDDGFTGSGSTFAITGNTENAHHVMITGGLTYAAVIDGFTIKGGNANGSIIIAYEHITDYRSDTYSINMDDGGGMYNVDSDPRITNTTFLYNTADGGGGGMRNDHSSPTITNVTFSDNTARNYGGGMYNHSSSGPYASDPTITNTIFSYNTAGDGGGIYNHSEAAPIITNTTFLHNTAGNNGGGMYTFDDSYPKITNTTFSYNAAGNNGGGMYNGYKSAPTITNTTFSYNMASSDGGGMYNETSSSLYNDAPIINNATFLHNTARNGGGMFNYFSSPSITNATFSYNTAGNSGGGMLNQNSSKPRLYNTIFWGNLKNGLNSASGADIQDLSSSLPSMNHCLTQSYTAGQGIITNQDPLFVDAANGDFSLQGCSPAINTGTTATYTTDILGNSHVGTADMGAYEYQGTKVEITVSAPMVTQPTCIVLGEIIVNATTTTGTVQYSIDNGTSYQSSNTFSNLVVGNYTIRVREQGSSCTKTYGSNPVVINPLTNYNTQIYVKNGATAGNNDGTSWANAFLNLQDAIDANCNGVDIWVAAGTYLPTDAPDGTPSTGAKDRNNTFHFATDMKIYGGFTGTETQLSSRNAVTNITILSGDFNGNDIVTGSGSTLSITNNTENAYHVMITANLTAAAVIDGFTIKGGNANGSGESIVYQSRVYNNKYGGGMFTISSSPIITNTTFLYNTANSGGGMHNRTSSSPTITNTIFSYNTTSDFGGGMYNSSSSDPILTNTTFSYNTAISGGGGIVNASSDPIIKNTIFWENLKNGSNSVPGADITNFSSLPTVSYCLTQNYSSGTGIIINEEPLFVDAANGDFSLQGCSPAINTGTATNAPTTDILGNPRVGIVDMGAYEYQGTKVEITVSAPTVTQLTCTVSTGEIIVNATTTTGTLQYSIDDGATYQASNTFSGLAAGNYTIRVKEQGSSCTETYGSLVVINTHVIITVSTPMVTQPNCTVSAGEIIVNASTTMGTLEYSNDNGTSYQNSNTFSGLAAGNYTIRVREQGSSCTKTYGIVVINAFNYTRIYVKTGATAGNNDGSSWANAFINLQDAIDANCNGIDIWVVAGTYLPTDAPDGTTSTGATDRNNAFHLATDMKIYGGFAGTETQLSARNAATNITILSGDFIGDDGVTGDESTLSITNNTENAYHVMITANLTVTAVIDGFTIKGGNANGSESISYQLKGYLNNRGGGVYNSSSSPTITNTTFLHNTAVSGGGMFTGSSSPIITNTTFSYNRADYGGGMVNAFSSSPTITNTIFSYNTAVVNSGGGMYNGGGSPIITNTTFSYNTAVSGGGMYNGSSSNPTITNTIFWENLKSNSNIALGADIESSSSSSPTVSYCLTQNYSSGTGIIINEDPLFVDAANGDFSLLCNSPAINTGTATNAPTTDVLGNPRVGIVDMGAYEYQGTKVEITVSAPTVTQLTCIVSTGEIIVNATATTGTLQYSIDDGATYQASNTFSDLVPGSYTIKVKKQGSSCTETYGSLVVINTHVIITVSAPTVTQPTCTVSAGEIIVNASTTMGTLEYSNDNGTSYQNSNTFSGLAAGNYNISVREQSSSCTKTYGIVVINALNYTRIYVKTGATAGNNNGSSWANAFINLQDAIDANCNGVDIWVAAGTYLPTASPDGTTTDNRNKAFHLATDMRIYGGFAGTETQLSQRNAATNITILAGSGNTFHVMITANLTVAAVIDGFSIKGGNANGNANGGGSISYQSRVYSKIYGGGMYNSSSSPTITNTTFSYNTAKSGGGMINSDSSPIITNTNFSYNTADSGGGISNFSSSPIITNTTFSYNTVRLFGGGMINGSSSSPIITNTTFFHNTAGNVGGLGGGGMANLGSSPIITNSIFWENLDGGSNNVPGADIDNNDSSPTVSYCLTQENSVYDGANNGVNNNGTGIINNQDPLFVDAAKGDFRLKGCSPAINAGTTVSHTTDILGNPHVGIVDMGAYEYQDILSAPTVTQPTCIVSTGEIIVNASTTTGTLQYSIDDGATYQASNTFSGLAAGSYTIKVKKQGSSCTETYGSNPVVINTPVTITVSAPIVTQPTCRVSTGTIVVDATTSTGTLEYSLNNGSYQSSNTFSSLGAGNYTISVNEQGSSCTETYGSNPVVINALTNYNTQIYVKTGATAGDNDGSSWSNAFINLQDAIDANCNGIDIWVAAGTYLPTDAPDGTTSTGATDRNNAFHLHTDMKIYGGFDGTETLLSQRDAATNITILSGDFISDDIVTGSGSTLSITDNTENAYHVMITANLTVASVIDGFRIKGGNANGNGTITYQSKNYFAFTGGGMFNESSSPTITNTTFLYNTADDAGGMYNSSSSPIITNTTFLHNAADNGGGMYNSSSSPIITNTTLSYNTAVDDGGGMYNIRSSPTITNSIFWENLKNNSNITFGAGITIHFSSPTVSYCLTQAGSFYDGVNNIGTGIINNQDPLFVDAANGDFSLQNCSPAINAGTATGITQTTDILGNPHVGIVDMGAYEFQELDPITITANITHGTNPNYSGVPSITSEGAILNTNNAVFKAQNYIELLPGFSVAPAPEQATVFRAEIEGCE
jgi:stringent starvation protein B